MDQETLEYAVVGGLLCIVFGTLLFSQMDATIKELREVATDITVRFAGTLTTAMFVGLAHLAGDTAGWPALMAVGGFMDVVRSIRKS